MLIDEAFDHLAAELSSRGIQLNFNPDRPVPFGGQNPVASAELVGLMRTFISHVKSNCLTFSAMRARLKSLPVDTFIYRHDKFLSLAEPVLDAWNAALAAEKGIDFEDMLNQAAELLESGRHETPFELVMADEFQDASLARARLCRALVQKPGRYFFAVGDDWQSINRFAGADVSVMTGFRDWFGHGQVLKLEQTFRCPQGLCDVSSRYILKNPAQIRKQVKSVTPAVGDVLQGFQVTHKDKLTDAIDQFVMRLAAGVKDGSIPPGREGKVSVYVLGRYNVHRYYVPSRKARFERWVDLSFLTIHRSKGNEADYVILPEMISVAKSRSFPNNRADDPVLTLAMPTGDECDQGEERRLFYVALTRARRSVAMFTVSGSRSSFLQELADEGFVSITDSDGNAIKEQHCPWCKQGVLVMRTGPYGEFRSCSNFFTCTYKPGKRASISKTLTDRGTAPTSSRSISATSALKSETSSALPRGLSSISSASQSNSTLAEEVTGMPNKQRFSVRSFFKAINDGVSQLNDYVTRAQALQVSTSELEKDLFAERTIIEAAFDFAKSTKEIEIKKQDPRFRELYEQNVERLGRLLEESGSEREESRRIVRPLSALLGPNAIMTRKLRRQLSAK
ncbi:MULTISPECIES: UvrD-helicase domain-containing protein [Burkholderiaceae]|uniref:UvrD-helicase domain-containing protein n=1 Tax=Burkholderiaceae TaxID=119060 RepID=UPI00068DD721|nr:MULTISPECIES: UvrD-helicase domain-containing protein [Burkholderiaceae]SAL58079.1 putative helicase [Caballeronia peredens]